MKKWIMVEAAMVVAIIFLGCLIKIQLTPVAQAQELDDFQIYVQTDQGLVPYSQFKIIKVEAEGVAENFDQPKFPALISFPYRQNVQQRIREIEPELGDTLILLANCESTLNPNAMGDDANSFGLYQIFLKWHTDVTREQALEIDFATRWTAQKIREGEGHIWSCWDKI